MALLMPMMVSRSLLPGRYQQATIQGSDCVPCLGLAEMATLAIRQSHNLKSFCDDHCGMPS
ncbi:hypothetical protein [Stenotrophomonas maltophilia]